MEKPKGGRRYTDWLVETRMADAKARRIIARRRGDPYWTVDPWQQRAGAGEPNINADTQGSGYR